MIGANSETEMIKEPGNFGIFSLSYHEDLGE